MLCRLKTIYRISVPTPWISYLCHANAVVSYRKCLESFIGFNGNCNWSVRLKQTIIEPIITEKKNFMQVFFVKLYFGYFAHRGVLEVKVTNEKSINVFYS